MPKQADGACLALSVPEFELARRLLMRRDPRLAVVIRRVGPCLLPETRTREPFAALVRALLNQQLSGKAAATIHGRVLTLVGGAIYSAYLFWRKKILINRMFGNILIAIGALSPAMGGSLLRAGLTDMLYMSELVGAILMFVGFLMATSGAPVTSSVEAHS